MSESTFDENIIGAKLVDGEAVIPEVNISDFTAFAEEVAKAETPKRKSRSKAAEEGVAENVIGSETAEKPKSSRSKKKESSMGDVGDNAIGSKSANKKDSFVATSSTKPETVAIFSTKNVTWSGVGKVFKGYNIVSKDHSEKWLTRSHVRLATPQEVAQELKN